SELEDSGPITDLSHLRDALERLYALPDVDATDDDLQIMTIHKAKGLEFGTVIVPGLDSGPGGGDPDLLLFHEMVGASRRPREGTSPANDSVGGGGPVGLLLAPIKPTGFDSDPTYRYLARLDTEAEDTEASRLLYVAITPKAREEEPIEFSWVTETSRHIGTVVHHWLQQIANEGARGWSEKRLDGLARSFTRDLVRRGLMRSDARLAAQQVATALKNAL